MKQRRQARLERRRSLVEINLISDTRPGMRAGLKPGSRTLSKEVATSIRGARGGCARLFGIGVLGVVALLTICSGHP